MSVKLGDIIAIKYSEESVAAGIVLHVSKQYIKDGAILGVFAKTFKDINEINIPELEAEKPKLLGVPNYISKKAISSGAWPKVGNSWVLFEYYGTPLLRAGYDLYLGDDFIGKMNQSELPNVTAISLAGRRYLQERLKRELPPNL